MHSVSSIFRLLWKITSKIWWMYRFLLEGDWRRWFASTSESSRLASFTEELPTKLSANLAHLQLISTSRLCDMPRETLREVSLTGNPLDSIGNYSATSNNRKLAHWPLMGGLLHLVQRGGLRPRPVHFSQYQMQQTTHQRPVYQLYIIRCGTITASEL